MKKTNTKKTLIIENQDIILEDYVDASGEDMFKKAAETGLGAFANLGKQIWSSTAQYAWDVGREYYTEDKSLKDALKGASRSLDRRYVRYSNQLDNIFNASGVASDVNMAVNLTFLPARGLDWYVGNEELTRIKNDVLKDQGKPLWNGFVQERQKQNKSWPPEWMKFDIDTKKRGSTPEREIFVLLFNIYVLLSEVTVPKRMNTHTNYKQLISQVGNKTQVADIINSVRTPGGTDQKEIQKCIFYLSDPNDFPGLANNQAVIDCLKVLYATTKYNKINKVTSELLTYSENAVINALKKIQSTIASKSLQNSTQSGKFKTDADTYLNSGVTLFTENHKNFSSLIIFNKSIKLLLEQGESEGESKEPAGDITAEDQTSEDVSAFARLMKKIADIQSDAVKQDLILYNLTKDMAYYNACITAKLNLENIYAEIIESLKDANKTPENVGSVIAEIVDQIKKSFNEKTKFYNECKENPPSSERLPDSLKQYIVLNKDTESLPQFNFDSSELIKDLKENYDVSTFKEKARQLDDNSIVLYRLPRNYLKGEAQLDNFFNDDKAVKMVLNLYGRKHLVDSLLTGSNKLDKNINEIDKSLNEMSAALDKLSKDESVKLKDLIRGAQSSNQQYIKNRVAKYSKALNDLNNTVDIVSKMEERVKSFEPLSKTTIEGIESIFKKFSNSSEQSEETITNDSSEEVSSQKEESQNQTNDDQNSES